jgi:hypothetical protein
MILRTDGSTRTTSKAAPECRQFLICGSGRVMEPHFEHGWPGYWHTRVLVCRRTSARSGYPVTSANSSCN